MSGFICIVSYINTPIPLAMLKLLRTKTKKQTSSAPSSASPVPTSQTLNENEASSGKLPPDFALSLDLCLSVCLSVTHSHAHLFNHYFLCHSLRTWCLLLFQTQNTESATTTTTAPSIHRDRLVSAARTSKRSPITPWTCGASWRIVSAKISPRFPCRSTSASHFHCYRDCPKISNIPIF